MAKQTCFRLFGQQQELERSPRIHLALLWSETPDGPRPGPGWVSFCLYLNSLRIVYESLFFFFPDQEFILKPEPLHSYGF